MQTVIPCAAALTLSLFLIGCQSVPPEAPFAPDSSFIDPAALTAAEAMPQAGSLFKEDQALMSNVDMTEILRTKVYIPEKTKLAVVRFGSMPYWWGWSEDFVRMNDQIDSDFLKRLKSSPHVNEVAYLPSLVTPREMTLPHLRQAAVRFQADMLLIYRTTTRNYSRSKMFAAEETKAFCTVEAILLDTRTGIVTWSTVLTEQFSSKRTSNDYDFAETTAKANQQAISKAWLRMADEAGVFLKSAPVAPN